MLPYVLFVYREVPQATVGFSPFELLYVRDPRELLDVLQEEWIQELEKDADILSYIMGVRNSMEMANELVEENTRRAQAKQKAYYGLKTKELNLQPGDKVLLLQQ